jgi:hypothetical protein
MFTAIDRDANWMNIGWVAPPYLQKRYIPEAEGVIICVSNLLKAC